MSGRYRHSDGSYRNYKEDLSMSREEYTKLVNDNYYENQRADRDYFLNKYTEEQLERLEIPESHRVMIKEQQEANTLQKIYEITGVNHGQSKVTIEVPGVISDSTLEDNKPVMFDAYYTLDEVIAGEAGEEARRKEKQNGLKFDSEKPPMDLIPYDALVEIAKVLQFGEGKYGTANWANGIEIRRLLSAALRHIGQFNSGEDLDDESGTLHIANAATNLLFAIWMMKNRPDMDNRWAKGIKT